MSTSITRRLVVLFTATTLAVVASVSVVLCHVLTTQMLRYQQRQLSSALHDRAYQIERIDKVDLWTRVDRKMAVLAPPDSDMRYWVLSDDPHFRYGTGLGLDLDPDAARRAAHGRMVRVRVAGHAPPFHVLARHFEANGQRPAVTLVVGLDTQPFTEARQVFMIALGVLSLAAAAAACALGRVVARIGLRPLQALSDQAGRLCAANLAQRLALSPLPQELASVTVAFNGALDRLQAAYVQLEAFNADVAHELRTPLTNLIGMTQVALARPREAAELTEVMHANLEDLERLRGIVNDMLFLARADHGEAPAALRDTCVAEEVGKTVAFLEPLLDEAGKTVALEGDLAARALLDGALFRRAVVNLLHNAILYSTPRARLVVRIERRQHHVAVAVVNPGAPIDPVHVPRLFDRFFRVDPARSHGPGQQGQGLGLGLAIVKAVAHMHGGAVCARSEHDITTIGFSVAIACPPHPPHPPHAAGPLTRK